MRNLVRSAARQACIPLALIALIVPPALASPATALPAQTEAAKTAAAAPSLASQLDEARTQLRQAVELRDKQAGRHTVQGRQDLALDKQRLLDWLADLQREKVKRLEELIALRNLATVPVGEDPLVKALQGTPPYSAIQVDALRDRIDGLKESLAAAEASFRANQAELQNLHDRLKDREAASRQAGEPALGVRSAAASGKDDLELLSLLKRVAEVEIAVTALDQERLKLQIAASRKRIEDLDAVFERVQPEQRLSQEDLAAQRMRVRTENEKLSAEIESMARQNARHHAERERLGAKAGADGDRTGKRAAFLDLALKTDNAILKGLDHLQMLNSVSGDAWEKRYIVLSAADPEQRRSALTALGELARKLTDFQGQSRARQEALRTEIRGQRILVDNLAGNRREQDREKEVLNLLLRQTAMDERVELAATRLGQQVSRWLSDFADAGRQGLSGRAAWVMDRAAIVFKRIWQQELFVAEDVSEVDGRQVTVKYGITVGKSVGLLVVFLVGYWLLARLSRLIQHQLVRRFKVSHQLASMIRRWAMIGLSLALIVLLLNLARIPLSVFAFLGGTLAIGVGFGSQTVIKNFISGLIMLMERKVRVGDVVELGGIAGYVTAVDLRATTVHGFNGVEALIPNANFIDNQVVNWTYSSREVRRELHVDVAYGTDVRQAEALFLAAAADHPHVLRNHAPEVFFDGFGDSALKVVLVYWMEFENPASPRQVDSDLRHDIYGRLTAAGISIPYPQRVVHVELAQPISVRAADLEAAHGT